MKLKLLYIIILLSLLLAACSNDTSSPKNVDESQETPNAESGKEVNFEDETIVEEIEELIIPLYELNAIWDLQPISDANPKAVLLTIDDAPDKRALDMAKTLKKLDAPAIFFVNGHFIDTDEEKAILKEIYDMGFTIGNHTKTHANLKQLDEEQQKEEISFVSNTVEEVTGERPKFFRAPFGVNTDFSKALVEEDGMLLMNWSYGYDWEKQYMDAAALTSIMVNTELLRNGSNLLMHDREWTADALKDIVEGLRAKGYEMIDPATIKGIEQ
ncbi:polysaccharide deacetylase family protein [Sporosarcina sp. G11-34]|uniref:polysaccharide deacetylase family protein n=1 Tax=Sporosarcina sp. G11-34 TaxID=2849605 RepID=UPI0022A955D6|nr:polysaccharide deacetylase family protein [Sporosarcina sp. G11-34]MCZ2258923.1 polysaccharide deacetylase family protein [Sporosarcina sp. G11-34]